MPVIHALVARGADVLAEYSSTTGANNTTFELCCMHGTRIRCAYEIFDWYLCYFDRVYPHSCLRASRSPILIPCIRQFLQRVPQGFPTSASPRLSTISLRNALPPPCIRSTFHHSIFSPTPPPPPLPPPSLPVRFAGRFWIAYLSATTA
jgi:hypothetical protein